MCRVQRHITKAALCSTSEPEGNSPKQRDRAVRRFKTNAHAGRASSQHDEHQ
jgi:hypothetical protein